MRTALLSVCTMMCLITTLLVPLTGPDHDGAEAWVMDRVNGTKDTHNITFGPGGGQDDSASMALPKDVPVYSARIGVQGHPDGSGKYPSNLWMDVGKDGDLDWMWWGTAYGALGHQNRFGNNRTTASVAFRGDDENTSAMVRLPAGAVVTGATMDVEGQPGDNYGVKLIRQDDTACRAYAYSSSSGTDPKLTINYVEGGSTVIQPDEAEAADTEVNEQSSGTNYGNAWQLLQWSSWEMRALLQFDVNTIDPDKTISSAVLEVNIYSYETGQDWSVHEVLEPWNEMTVNWNNQPDHKSAYEAIKDLNWQSTSQWADWDVTDLVNKWAGYQPTNVTLDLGGDGKVEYESQGVHNYTNTTLDFTGKLNQYLESASPTYEDEYGNRFVDVPIHATSNSTGALVLSNLSIDYDWTATVFKNPHNFNLTNEVNELMDSIPPAGGEVPIHINIHSETAGKLQLRDINVTYNGAPVLVEDIPSNLTLDEDTSVMDLVDLSGYFTDDYLLPRELDYKVTQNTREGVVNAYITDDHWLAVDSDTSPESANWHGTLTVAVKATDEMGFTAESNDFLVTVNPVNDEPVKGDELIPDISLSEGGASKPIDLDDGDHFRDVDGDELFFEALVDPLETYEGEDITVEIDNNGTKEMVVRGVGDFAGSDIPVRIYCDDGIGEPAGVYWDIRVDVINANDDPPVWDPLPDVEVQEDSRLEDALRLDDYVHDIDNDPSSLRYVKSKQTNESYVSMTIDSENFVDIDAKGDNWTGISTVTLRAMDDGNNIGEGTFRIIVTPVNDAPVVTLKSPTRGSLLASRRAVLQWEGKDAESPAEDLRYSIYMGEDRADTLLEEDVAGTSYEVQVENGRAYTWTVSATDGAIDGPRARERSFSVDFGSGPQTDLESPQDGSFVTAGSADLSWTVAERPSGLGGKVNYDVYLGEGPDGLQLVDTGVTSPGWAASGLKDGVTYHWTVVPSDNLGEGTCGSGTWSFQVDFDFAGYGVEVSVLPDSISAAPGSTGAVTLTVTNTGAADDNYKFTGAMVDVPGTTIETDLDDPDEFSVARGEARDVTVTISIPGSTAPGNYALELEAKSLKGSLTGTANVTVTVTGGGGGSGGGDGDGGGSGEEPADAGGIFGSAQTSGFLALAFLALAVVLIVVLLLMTLMYRKKSARVEELEGRRRLEPASMVDAELAFSPDGAAGSAVGGTGAVEADRQLGSGGAVAVAGAGVPKGTAGPEPLALPKAATGGTKPGGEGGDVIEVDGGAPAVGAADGAKPVPAPRPAPRPGPKPVDRGAGPQPGGEAPPSPEPRAPGEGSGQPKGKASGDGGKASGGERSAQEDGGSLGTLPGDG